MRLHKSFFTVFCLLPWLLWQCQDKNSSSNAEKSVSFPQDTASGQALSLVYCQSCHAYPEPSVLDKETWRKDILPRMGYFMGIYEDTVRSSLIEPGEAARLVTQANVYPEQPLLSASAWEKIKAFYIQNAPEALQSATRATSITQGLSIFRVKKIDIGVRPAMTTSVKMVPTKGWIVFSDTKSDATSLNIVNTAGKLLEQVFIQEQTISAIQVSGDTLIAAVMGRMLPTDAPIGVLKKIFKLPNNPSYSSFINVAAGLQRPVDFIPYDLDQDGREDVVMNEFGNLTGGLSWLQQQSDGGYVKRSVHNRPGAAKSIVTDINNDEKPDILALFAQGDESIWAFYNEGKGTFRKERLLQFSPAFGSTDFLYVDVNQDGHRDIAYSNGDNGDLARPVMKPYHGLRIYLNDGQNHFKEQYFYPVNGAFQVAAEDFDQDGDADLALISFYPDYARQPEEGFLYFTNQGDMNFRVSALGDAVPGRWMSMDTGDVDQDGDLDIVLGSFVAFEPVPNLPNLHSSQLSNSPSLVLLLNHAVRRRNIKTAGPSL